MLPSTAVSLGRTQAPRPSTQTGSTTSDGRGRMTTVKCGATHSPTFIDFMDFMSHLGKAPLLPCPNDDPHACALYYYTELGDHIGFHYDTSYYKGARYTALMGLVQRSMPCQLVCQLYENDPQRDRKKLRLPTTPGSW